MIITLIILSIIMSPILSNIKSHTPGFKTVDRTDKQTFIFLLPWKGDIPILEISVNNINVLITII